MVSVVFVWGGGPGDLRTPSLLMGLTWPLVIHPVPGLLEQSFVSKNVIIGILGHPAGARCTAGKAERRSGNIRCLTL